MDFKASLYTMADFYQRNNDNWHSLTEMLLSVLSILNYLHFVYNYTYLQLFKGKI